MWTLRVMHVEAWAWCLDTYTNSKTHSIYIVRKSVSVLGGCFKTEGLLIFCLILNFNLMPAQQYFLSFLITSLGTLSIKTWFCFYFWTKRSDFFYWKERLKRYTLARFYVQCAFKRSILIFLGSWQFSLKREQKLRQWWMFIHSNFSVGESPLSQN